MLYSADPWAAIAAAARDRVDAQDIESAESFVRQAEEYFRAAEAARSIETKPVLYYYSFLNLAKTLGLATNQPGLVGPVHHGISSDNLAPQHASLDVFPSTQNKTNLYDTFHRSLFGVAVGNQKLTYTVAELMPQSVVGHRLWCESFAQERRERFISPARISLLEDGAAKIVWSVVEFAHDDLKRLDRSLQSIKLESGLSPDWDFVADGVLPDGRRSRRMQQVIPTAYTDRSADEIPNVVALLRPRVHRTILTARPYRRYYVYLAPANSPRVPPLLVTYALMYYLGSLTRYQPRTLLDSLNGDFGGFLREFLATQPAQFVYEFASVIREREVSRAEIV